jgi:hypothetical protein
MNFIPDTPKNKSAEVPYFDDVSGDAGWQGQSTSKSLEALKSEIMSSVGRLGGLVTGFQRGQFAVGNQKRDGFRLAYVVETPSGQMVPGRIDIAALPVKDDYNLRRSYDTRREKSLKMALYMLRTALDGTWFLQQLSPGYSALMPWMLADGEKTISQLWGESPIMARLLPPAENDFVEGIVTVTPSNHKLGGL